MKFVLPSLKNNLFYAEGHWFAWFHKWSSKGLEGILEAFNLPHLGCVESSYLYLPVDFCETFVEVICFIHGFKQLILKVSVGKAVNF
jgi:hypothetical protein